MSSQNVEQTRLQLISHKAIKTEITVTPKAGFISRFIVYFTLDLIDLQHYAERKKDQKIAAETITGQNVLVK